MKHIHDIPLNHHEIQTYAHQNGTFTVDVKDYSGTMIESAYGFKTPDEAVNWGISTVLKLTTPQQERENN